MPCVFDNGRKKHYLPKLFFYYTCVIKEYKASGYTVHLLVSTILKVMAQLQMLYSEWLDQDLVGWFQISYQSVPTSIGTFMFYHTPILNLFSMQIS